MNDFGYGNLMDQIMGRTGTARYDAVVPYRSDYQNQGYTQKNLEESALKLAEQMRREQLMQDAMQFNNMNPSTEFMKYPQADPAESLGSLMSMATSQAQPGQAPGSAYVNQYLQSLMSRM